MKLILIRSPQLLFYKMKSTKEDNNMTTDKITISYNRSFSRDVIPFPVGHIGVPLSTA